MWRKNAWLKYNYFSDFDLTTWLGTNSYTDSSPLSPLVITELTRFLQLEDYLQPTHCVPTSAPYTSVNSEGWAVSSGKYQILLYPHNISLLTINSDEDYSMMSSNNYHNLFSKHSSFCLLIISLRTSVVAIIRYFGFRLPMAQEKCW